MDSPEIASAIRSVPTDVFAWLASHQWEQIEKAAILAHLNQNLGNRTKTAESLNMSVRTLGMKLKLWGMTARPPKTKPPQ